MFPISRDPPEGGTNIKECLMKALLIFLFPISRDPPEGGTPTAREGVPAPKVFPISRDPPEGGTQTYRRIGNPTLGCFQFLGIPPKGEPYVNRNLQNDNIFAVSNF